MNDISIDGNFLLKTLHCIGSVLCEALVVDSMNEIFIRSHFHRFRMLFVLVTFIDLIVMGIVDRCVKGNVLFDDWVRRLFLVHPVMVNISQTILFNHIEIFVIHYNNTSNFMSHDSDHHSSSNHSSSLSLHS